MTKIIHSYDQPGIDFMLNPICRGHTKYQKKVKIDFDGKSIELLIVWKSGSYRIIHLCAESNSN